MSWRSETERAIDEADISPEAKARIRAEFHDKADALDRDWSTAVALIIGVFLGLPILFYVALGFSVGAFQ